MITVLQLVPRYRGDYELLDLQACLDPQRFRTVVCYLGGEPDGHNEVERVCSRVIYLRCPERVLRWFDPWLVWRLARLIDAEGIDVVSCQPRSAVPFGVLAAGLAKRRPGVVAVVHGLGDVRARRRKLLMALHYRRLHRVVAVSQTVADDLLASSWRLPPSLVTVIPNGLDYAPYLQAVDCWEAREEILPGMAASFCFGAVVRLHRVKDHLTLIAAFADVCAGSPDGRGALLVIAGRGELEHELRAAARRLGVAERVAFLGYRRDVPRLLQALDTFVLPSRREAAPLVLLEAMAAARPVVATAVGGVPEVVGASGCATLVPPGDSAALAHAMKQLLTMTPQEREAMGQRGRRRALAAFPAEIMIRAYEDLYAGAAVQASPRA